VHNLVNPLSAHISCKLFSYYLVVHSFIHPSMSLEAIVRP
jgi:hypothetical protein